MSIPVIIHQDLEIDKSSPYQNRPLSIEVDKKHDRGDLTSANYIDNDITRDFSSRVTRSFVGRRPTRLRLKAEDFLRLDRNRKPRMKSLWQRGYDSFGTILIFFFFYFLQSNIVDPPSPILFLIYKSWCKYSKSKLPVLLETSALEDFTTLH